MKPRTQERRCAPVIPITCTTRSTRSPAPSGCSRAARTPRWPPPPPGSPTPRTSGWPASAPPGTPRSPARCCSRASAGSALGPALAAAVGHDDAIARQLDALPDLLAMLLGQEAWEDLATRFGGRRRYWVVGAGPNTATALEAALKLNEAAWIPAIGLNAEQFLH